MIPDCSHDYLSLVHGLDTVSSNQRVGHIRPRQNHSALHHLGLPLRESQRSLQSDCLRNQVNARLRRHTDGRARVSNIHPSDLTAIRSIELHCSRSSRRWPALASQQPRMRPPPSPAPPPSPTARKPTRKTPPIRMQLVLQSSRALAFHSHRTKDYNAIGE